jgi:hypothetical protein
MEDGPGGRLLLDLALFLLRNRKVSERSKLGISRHGRERNASSIFAIIGEKG